MARRPMPSSCGPVVCGGSAMVAQIDHARNAMWSRGVSIHILGRSSPIHRCVMLDLAHVSLAQTGSAIAAAFLASLVEFVEALTIVLAVGTVRGWRPALIGAGGGVAVLATLVAALGPALGLVPIAY